MVRVHFPRWICSYPSAMSSIDIHPDGTRFVTAVNGDSVSPARLTFWNMEPVRNSNKKRPTEQQQRHTTPHTLNSVGESDGGGGGGSSQDGQSSLGRSEAGASAEEESEPRILCEKEVPHASVNCVRWSGAGHLLASAEDEHVVIWCYSKSIESTFGSRVANVENWKQLHVIRGHQGNVFDLRWSPGDRYLASCSVDNKIIIWNGKRLPELLRTLTGHTNLVKGLCWDPLGKFLASQSDDKTLRVWRTSDWGEETKVFKPFTREFTTHYLRCDWSPDGQMLVSSHAVNNEGPVAVICARKEGNNRFQPKMDFVGHRRAITCIRFHPRMIVVKGTSEVTCLLAIASRDRSVSFWLSNRPRAFLTLHELVDDEIVDMSWSLNAIELAVCSIRGLVKFVLFSPSELGQLLSVNDQVALLKRLHPDEMNCQGGQPTVLVSDPDMMPYLARAAAAADKEAQESQEQQLNRSNKATAGDKENNTSGGSSQRLVTSSTMISTTQKEVIKDGRRRITPVCLGLQEKDVDDNAVVAPVPFRARQEKTLEMDWSNNAVSSTTSPEATMQLSPEQQSQQAAITTSICDLKVPPLFNSLQMSLKQKKDSAAAQVSNANLVSSTEDPNIQTQNMDSETKADQTQKPTEQPNVSCSPDSSTLPREQLAPSTSKIVASGDTGAPPKSSETGAVPKPGVTNRSDIDSVKSAKMSKAKKLKQNALKSSASKTGMTSLFQSQGAKRRKRVLFDDDDDSGDFLRTEDEKGRPKWFSSKQYADNDSRDDSDSDNESDGEVYSPITIIEPAVAVDSFSYSYLSKYSVAVANNVSIGALAPPMNRFDFIELPRNEIQFTKSLMDPIVGVACSEDIVAVACADDSVFVFDHTGCLLNDPLIVDASIAQIQCKNYFLMVVTCEVTVSVFDYKQGCSVIMNCQLTNLFKSADVKLKKAFLAEDGSPVIVTTAMKAYRYNSKCKAWVLAQLPKWTHAKRLNRSLNLSPGSENLREGSLLLKLGDFCSENPVKDAALHSAVEKVRNDPTACEPIERLTHSSAWLYCELQEKLAIDVKSANSYKKWFLETITELSWLQNEKALRAKLDRLIENVIPTLSSSAAQSSDQPENQDPIDELGLNRTELLNETLEIIGRNANNQKIFSEYRQIVKQL